MTVRKQLSEVIRMIPLKPCVCLTILAVSVLLAPVTVWGADVGEAIDYKRHACYPDRWEKLGVYTTMYPWEGERVVLLTTGNELEPKVMKRIVGRLDAGWGLYAELIGKEPKAFKQLNDKVTIAALPDGRLTCGLGCGWVGATGIEVAKFYNEDLPMVAKDPDAFPHYFFYEMGRNYFVFGDRHSVFKTGFAVFMRYVCMDALKCTDPERRMREQIEGAEAVYAETDMSFLDAFTVKGRLSEKQGRLRDFSGPSDQPVMYASAMLYLQEQCGGRQFLKEFFKQLHTCPQVAPKDPESALLQSMNWLVAASCAAGNDLTLVFVDRWRMPLSDATRKALQRVDWKKEGIEAGRLLESIEVQFVGLAEE